MRFVGRRNELDQVTTGLRATVAGVGQVALVSGEPGIGKTRLAREAAAVAETQGLATCWGRAVQDDGSPSYWPFRQVLRVLAKQHAAGQLSAELALIAPEFGDGPTRPITSAEERFRVFEAVTEYLTGVGPLLIVLDDLHWADQPTLELLVHLTRTVHSSQLMILATYRDTEIHEALSRTLASLAREIAVTPIRLVGLTEAEVADQLAELTGERVSSAVAATVSRRTHGNPFFVGELGRLLHQDADRLPDAVRDAVRVRLDALSAGCRDLLIAGAVLGSELDPATLAAVLARPIDDVLTALDEAGHAGMVSTSDGWRFTHDLVREVARLIMPTAARLALHERTAVYLAARGDASIRAAEIAHHWLESLPAGDPVQAFEWAERAADAAMAQLAWENAADLYARALRANPDLASADRSRLLRQQGTAQLRKLDIVGAEETFRVAAVAAREANDANGIAEVALAMESVSSADWVQTGKALCDEALALLPPDDNPLRARLLAQQAAELSFYGNDGVEPLSREALAIADRTGDPLALRAALRARQLALAGPDGVRERLELGSRMLALGAADKDPEATMWGRLWRFDAFCQLGQLDDAEAELSPINEAVTAMRTQIARWHHVRSAAAIACARGRLAEARELSRAAIDLVKDTGGPVVLAISVHTLGAVLAMTGDEQELLDEYPDIVFQPPDIIAAMVGAFHADCGRLDVARRLYQPKQAFESMGGMRELSVLASLAKLAALFDDKEVAAEVYRRLRPHGELLVCGGAGIVTIEGAGHSALGTCAATLDRLDDAVRHFREAIEINDRAGVRPFAGWARLQLARVLARRRRTGDADESVALAVSARTSAERIGMKRLVAAAEQLSGTGSAVLTKRELEVAKLVAQGLTNKQIAATTHISVRTVETHIQHILGKLGFTTRNQVMAWVLDS